MTGKSRSPYLVIQVAYNFSFSSHETQVTTLFTITDLIPYTLLCMPLYMMLILYMSLSIWVLQALEAQLMSPTLSWVTTHAKFC
jgi:hypothetical protein